MKRSNRDNFASWMAGKIRVASSGMILDHATGEIINVPTAPSRVFLEHTNRRAGLHRTIYKEVIHRKALDQAKADSSNPFAYAKTLSELNNGLCELDDYDVKFVKQTVDMLDLTSLNKVLGRKVIDMPINVRRP